MIILTILIVMMVEIDPLGCSESISYCMRDKDKWDGKRKKRKRNALFQKKKKECAEVEGSVSIVNLLF